MITLGANDTLAGGASAATAITYTIIGGMTLNGTTETYDILAQGQLAASSATIYTAPATGPAFIRSLTVVNTDVSARTFQLFVNGTANANAITGVINLGPSSMATYGEHGWTFVPEEPGEVNEYLSGYIEQASIAVPTAPSTGFLRLHAHSEGGRPIPGWMPPGGVDQSTQPQLWGNHIVTYYPSSGTNGGTATLGGWGQSWTANGTVSHPTPASGSLYASMHRTRYANVVTTANQVLGLTSLASGTGLNWFRGDGGGRGGFFFHARVALDLWAAATCRIWVGLQSSTTSLVAADIGSATGDFCGFAHDIVDSSTQMWFATRDNTTTSKASITLSSALAQGNVYDFYIYCEPGSSTIYYRLDDETSGTSTTMADTSTTSNLPRTTIFMGPSITLSNGTANTTATTVGPGIAKVYIESDY